MRLMNFDVRFKHNNVKSRDLNAEGKVINVKYHKNKSTVCRILNTTGDVLAEGKSIVFKTDQFNKRIGRKVAFTRALHQLADKQTRRDLFKEYTSIDKKCINC